MNSTIKHLLIKDRSQREHAVLAINRIGNERAKIESDFQTLRNLIKFFLCFNLIFVLCTHSEIFTLSFTIY